MGSKRGIAKSIISLFPKSENFYDLFGGGFSITHAMLLHRKNDFKTFYFNEIQSDIVTLIKKAIAGDFNYDKFKPKFITREEFFEKKDTDPYVKSCWSFGTDLRTYMFSKDLEKKMQSLHNAVIFNNFDSFAKDFFGHSGFKESSTIQQRRSMNLNIIQNRFPHDPSKIELLSLLPLQCLERLQRLERLEGVQQLDCIERLMFTSMSYDEVEIKPNSIIYCDPPYKGTKQYLNEFNTKKFLDWADEQHAPVFISEYEIKDKRFRCIKKIEKRAMLTCYREKLVIKEEKIYVNKAALKLLLNK